jgi:hypothetical protein
VNTVEESTMDLETFHRTREYKSLTASQRAWVDHYVTNGDASAATLAAYPNGNPAYCRMLTAQLERNRRIVACLNKFFLRSDRDAFLLQLEANAEQADGIAKTQILSMIARLKFNVGDESNGEQASHALYNGPRFTPGDELVQDGKRYRVTTVDPKTGRPLTADEVA